jgi:hypothetical protein
MVETVVDKHKMEVALQTKALTIQEVAVAELVLA